jgi:hypothetical protein
VSCFGVEWVIGLALCDHSYALYKAMRDALRALCDVCDCGDCLLLACASAYLARASTKKISHIFPGAPRTPCEPFPPPYGGCCIRSQNHSAALLHASASGAWLDGVDTLDSPPGGGSARERLAARIRPVRSGESSCLGLLGVLLSGRASRHV